MITATPTAPAKTQDRIDWSQFCFPGPRRVFTADELARAGGDRPCPTLVAAVGARLQRWNFTTAKAAAASPW